MIETRNLETAMSEAYIFARIKVKDFGEYFERYAAPFLEVLPEFDGEVVIATTDAQPLEGDDQANWTVLLKFPSSERARAFYESPAYTPLKDLRIDALTEANQVVLVSQPDPS